MSRKTQSRKTSHRASKRETRLDFKLYRYYHSRKAAERDLSRLVSKARYMAGWSQFFLMNRVSRDSPAIGIEEMSKSAANAPPGADYQSILISKPARSGAVGYSREYVQDSDGDLSEVRGGIHVAEDPDGFEAPPPPRDTPVSPSTLADDYTPLKVVSPKTGKLINHPSRSFVHKETGEVISRRQHMKLRGIIPEIPAAERDKYIRVVVSYGVDTHE
ncbi:hypothetical protein KO465_04405 [Candidatus Micrarchaeota archaeon]|nr:hypothetical protein [Candidatus Micrarchaeota archaeon]